MFTQVYEVHQNDRADHAKRLQLSLEEFDRLVASANNAHTILTELGSFYGREEIKEPTFRVTAEPVRLTHEHKEILMLLGNDLFYLGKAIQQFPEEIKKKLGADLDFRVPPTWRIDAIVDKKGKLKINEIEGQDGANALMMAEQLAYNLQTLSESTAAKIIPTLKAMCQSAKNKELKIALIRVDVPNNPHSPNANRFIHFIKHLSKNTISMDHINETTIRDGSLIPNWQEYDGVINETSLSPKELFALGVKEEQLLATGNYNALVNKGVFALLFDNALHAFWLKKLGKERFVRLTNLLIPSTFVKSEKELEEARKQGKVVKVSWADTNTLLINRSRGVALPESSLEQSSDQRWSMLKTLLQQGVTIIAQDFIEPARLFAFLRKRGTTLEPVEWYNRLCIKYVVEGNPHTEQDPAVALTAVEVTLGPEIVPAGRKCAFTAGVFV